MATLRAHIKGLLADDATLQALLPGGIRDSTGLPQDMGGMGSAPKVGAKIVAHANMVWKQAVPFGPEKVKAEIETLEVYAYQNAGYADIAAATAQMYTLLHRKYHSVDDRQLAFSEVPYISPDIPAMDLDFLPSKFIRITFRQVR